MTITMRMTVVCKTKGKANSYSRSKI